METILQQVKGAISNWSCCGQERAFLSIHTGIQYNPIQCTPMLHIVVTASNFVPSSWTAQGPCLGWKLSLLTLEMAMNGIYPEAWLQQELCLLFGRLRQLAKRV